MKKQTITLAIVLLLTVQFSLNAQKNNHHKNYLEIGINGGLQNSKSASGGVYGAFGTSFMLFGRASSFDFRSKESYITNPDQQGTLITFTLRTGLTKGLFAGIGGAHAHQIGIDEFLIHPVSSLLGSNTKIYHSSGFNLELGYNFNSFIKDKFIGIYPNVLLSYSHLFGPDYHFSVTNLILSAGFKIGFKKWN